MGRNKDIVGVPPDSDRYESPERSTKKTQAKEPVREPDVEPEAVARALRINPTSLPLGLKEYRVNLCKLGLSKSNCGTKVFSATKFKVMCRDSEGTVQEVNTWNFEPMAGKNVEWRIGMQGGRVVTNSQGEGLTYALDSRSPKYERYILISGKHSLGLRLNQVKQIVVPYYWCG